MFKVFMFTGCFGILFYVDYSCLESRVINLNGARQIFYPRVFVGELVCHMLASSMHRNVCGSVLLYKYLKSEAALTLPFLGVSSRIMT